MRSVAIASANSAIAAIAISVRRPIRLILLMQRKQTWLIVAAQARDRDRRDVAGDMEKGLGDQRMQIVEIAGDPARAAAVPAAQHDDGGFQ